MNLIDNWPKTTEAAKEVQNQLRDQVILQDQFSAPKLIGGADVGFEENDAIARAAVVV